MEWWAVSEGGKEGELSLMLKWSAMEGDLTEAAKRKPATASQLNK